MSVNETSILLPAWFLHVLWLKYVVFSEIGCYCRILDGEEWNDACGWNSAMLLLRRVLVLRIPHGKNVFQKSRMAQHNKSPINKWVSWVLSSGLTECNGRTDLCNFFSILHTWVVAHACVDEYKRVCIHTYANTEACTSTCMHAYMHTNK